MLKPITLVVLGTAALLSASCNSSGDSNGSGSGAQPNAGRGATSAGTSGTAGTSGVAGKTCSGGEKLCGGACVDTQSDPGNCGACSKACTGSQVCSAGVCAVGCADDKTECSRACVDTQTSASNCGKCGQACAAQETCSGGACLCPSDRDTCGGSCVNTAVDPSNCGTCGKTCDSGETCKAGACQKAAEPPPVVTASCAEGFAEEASCSSAAPGKVYYVSTAGNDQNDGLSEAKPIKTLAKAGALKLSPGDQVRFKCGDLWRGETLAIGSSGTECKHVLYGSYPATCENQPRFSGALPITGWTRGEGSLWVADLAAGENQGRFPNGINQLFRGEQRLPLGSWPNADDTGNGIANGYSHIDTQPGSNVIQDTELPAGDWTGAVVRYFSIRWLLLNRQVKSSSGQQLTLNSAASCYSDTCGNPEPSKSGSYGWGYHLTNHLATLDQQDEWYFDESAKKVYLVSGAEPTAMEGSAIPSGVKLPHQPTNDEGYRGLIELGTNMTDPIHHVVVENLRVENGWRHGITTPVNQNKAENSYLVIRCNTMRNLDAIGLQLATWVLGDPSSVDAWRGGTQIVVANNVVDGPNNMGIQSYAHDSVFQDNLIKNVGLLENLGKSGLGCPFEGENCTENGDGVILRRDNKSAVTSMNVVFRRNRIERSGYCGLDTFGKDLVFEENVVQEACYTKADCGGIRTFGATNIDIKKNIVLDVLAPTHGTNSEYNEQFGFGLYIDAGSVADATGNVIRNSLGYGIIYQGEGTKGSVVGNTLFGIRGRSMVFSGFDGVVDALTDNVLVGGDSTTLALFAEGNGTVGTSDRNYFIQPYKPECIKMELPPGNWKLRTLAQWQADSGKDAASKAAWFTLAAGAAPTMELFYNDTATDKTMTLSKSYVDLDQKAVTGSLTVAPYSAKVLVAQ